MSFDVSFSLDGKLYLLRMPVLGRALQTLHISSVRSLNKSEEERILSRMEIQHFTKYRKIS